MAEAPTNWIDYLVSLSPVLQTGLWSGVALTAIYFFKSPLADLIQRLATRVKDGDDIKTPWISFERQKQLNTLKEAEPQSSESPSLTDETKTIPRNIQAYEAFRDEIYEKNRRIFIVHVISPSKRVGQLYDVYIFLTGHKSEIALKNVKFAEFYLGKYWKKRIFKETMKNGLIGMKTSAYGPFLCVCKVTMNDGTKIMLDRYIDFEAGQLSS